MQKQDEMQQMYLLKAKEISKGLSKEGLEKAQQYMQKVFGLSKKRMAGISKEITDKIGGLKEELERQGKRPSPDAVADKLKEVIYDPILESAKNKIFMFIGFLEQTQDVESAVMLTECADSVIRDSRKGV